MTANEVPNDPDPTNSEIPPAVEEEEEEEKTDPNEGHKGSMLPRYIYDTSSVTERLMRRADAEAKKDSARDGKTSDGENSQGIHPNNTKAKDGDHEESNPK
ncbi:hypothetical protein NCS52_01086000 [Fusarium sp. LHS14.1]|nr:hypothetical protein NCS52_01086000 [Fusarium sp. LHS14.1]